MMRYEAILNDTYGHVESLGERSSENCTEIKFLEAYCVGDVSEDSRAVYCAKVVLKNLAKSCKIQYSGTTFDGHRLSGDVFIFKGCTIPYNAKFEILIEN